MKRRDFVLSCTAATVASLSWGCGQQTDMRRISLDDLRDKIRGGWVGQMIGVSFGAPTEFRYLQRIMEDPFPEWNPGRLREALTQDDLYVDMTLAQVLDDHGLDATTEDVGRMFRDVRYRLWHANLAARRNLKRGISPLESGTPRYNAHANDIDFQIEADFIGLMAPGLLQASNDYCYRFGRVMNHGDGILGGAFVSAMYAAAFFENDPRTLVETGLAVMPAESEYAQLITDVLAWHRQRPDDWKWNWQQIQDKWDRDEPCPAGALRPFNIDAKLNGGYIALGMLYGDGEIGKTLEISTRAGQDSDCNPASAVGILGVVLGYSGIPDEWKEGTEAIADEKFEYTNYTLNEIVASTEKRAIALVERNGGKLSGNMLSVRLQEPQPMRLELWNDYGKPVERIDVSDRRWSFSGPWVDETRGSAFQWRASDKEGATAVVRFEGTGVMLVGPYLSLQQAGTAEITLDDREPVRIDVSSDEDRVKDHESLFHDFNLAAGEHELRVRVLGQPYQEATEAKIALRDVVVFQK
jgi:hypothetical protein